MSALQNVKALTEREIEQLTGELDEQFAAIGEQALADTCVPPDEPFPALLSREQELGERLRALVERKERAGAVLARVEALEDQKRGGEIEHKALLKELEPLFAPIGEQAFEIYRGNPLVDNEYAEIFAPLVEQTEGIKESEREVEKLAREEEGRPFLERVVAKGKLALARNRTALRRGQLQRLYAKAGKQIAATEFISSIGAPSLDEVSAPYLDRMEAIRRIEEDLQAVDDELEALSQEFAALCEGVRAKGCVRDLEQLISQAMQERQQTLTTIGQAIVGSDSGAALSEQVARSVTAVGVTRQQIDEKSSFVARIDAALEVERLEDKIAGVERSIERKEHQLSELGSAIEELKLEQKELQKLRKKKASERGNLSELVPQTEPTDSPAVE